MDWIWEEQQRIVGCQNGDCSTISRYTDLSGFKVIVFTLKSCFLQVCPDWRVYRCDGTLFSEYNSICEMEFEGRGNYSNPELIWSCSNPLSECNRPSCPVTPNDILCLDWLQEKIRLNYYEYCEGIFCLEVNGVPPFAEINTYTDKNDNTIVGIHWGEMFKYL